MGVRTEVLGAECLGCGEKKVRVSLKDPFLDDYLDVCQNDSCNLYRDGASSLNNMSNAVARELDKLPDWGSDV